MNNLYLYGPPGSGKTTLGKLLSERLALSFLDLDRFIQNDAGMTVKAIFAAEGEEGFRLREKRALREAMNNRPPQNATASENPLQKDSPRPRPRFRFRGLRRAALSAKRPMQFRAALTTKTHSALLYAWE